MREPDRGRSGYILLKLIEQLQIEISNLNHYSFLKKNQI